MFNLLQFAQLFYEIYSVFCSLVVKNQLLRQTFYQFGPIPPHFCGYLIKNQKKNQVASPGGRRLSTEVIIALYNLLNLMDIVVLYCGDMNMKRHKVIILSKVSC